MKDTSFYFRKISENPSGRNGKLKPTMGMKE